MVNCKADNIAQKLSRSYWKQGKSLLCKKCYKGLSINSCSVDVSAIKNALLKHYQIYSKIPTVGAAQVFSLELHPQFHFLRFFCWKHLFSGTPESIFFSFFFFLTAMCRARIYSLCFYLFLQKIIHPAFFSTS